MCTFTDLIVQCCYIIDHLMYVGDAVVEQSVCVSWCSSEGETKTLLSSLVRGQRPTTLPSTSQQSILVSCYGTNFFV